MAKILSNAGIVTGLPVEAEHVSQSVNALTAAEAYDIIISGSLTVNNLKYPIVDGAAGQCPHFRKFMLKFQNQKIFRLTFG